MQENTEELHVLIEAASRNYARNDETFIEHVESLRRSMASAGIRTIIETQPGSKGGAEIATTIQAVIAGGAGLTTLCGLVKFWLKQRGDRLMRLTVHSPDGTNQVIQLDGKNVTDEELTKFAKSALTHVR